MGIVENTYAELKQQTRRPLLEQEYGMQQIAKIICIKRCMFRELVKIKEKKLNYF